MRVCIRKGRGAGGRKVCRKYATKGRGFSGLSGLSGTKRKRTGKCAKMVTSKKTGRRYCASNLAKGRRALGIKRGRR